MGDSREGLVEVSADRSHLLLHRVREGHVVVGVGVPGGGGGGGHQVGEGEGGGDALGDLLQPRDQGEGRVRLVFHRLAEVVDAVVDVVASERVAAAELHRVAIRIFYVSKLVMVIITYQTTRGWMPR